MYPFRSRRRYGAILVLVLATSGCDAPTGLGSGTVAAVDRDQTIAITNRTRRDVYLFAVGCQAAALINWAQCVSGPSCVPLRPGETRRIPYSAALISGAERGAIVYWWHAVRGPDGRLRPGSVQRELVPLSDD